LGISQPWGEYMAQEDRTHSPFIFADTLIRSGLTLAALDLELVMGVGPRGSYCRDLLDTSRLLDMDAVLGGPLRLTVGYASGDGPRPPADREPSEGMGFCRGGPTPAAQADWAANMTHVVTCKPAVQAVTWTHLADADAHQFPHCGLLDDEGNWKPVAQKLRD